MQRNGIKLPPLGLDLKIRQKYHTKGDGVDENRIDENDLPEGWDNP